MISYNNRRNNNPQHWHITEIYFKCILIIIVAISQSRCSLLSDDSDGSSNDTSDFEYENYNNRNQSFEYDIANCCKLAYGSCRLSCENLSAIQLDAITNGKDSKLNEIRRLCPSALKEYWSCMNDTLHAIVRGATWSGRMCCSLAVTTKCQNTCIVSTNQQEILKGCRRSDEQTLFTCLERQEIGDDCCGNARTSECLQACRTIFKSERSVTEEQRSHVEYACNDNNTNHKVLKCIKQITDLTPINDSKQYLPCCKHAPTQTCHETCESVLKMGPTTQEQIIDALMQQGCGLPMPHEPFWQCFLSTDHKIVQLSPTDAETKSQISQFGMDSAKLHCCHKAHAPKCRRLCIQTFSSEWTETRVSFDIGCYGQLNEVALTQCLDEVDEPCELGCDGLSFCTNFNNRPVDLFRNCNAHADNAAKVEFMTWKDNRSLSLPGLNLPIKNIETCSPDVWQAVACLLQIKPCSRSKHLTQICREDCINLLTSCMDWTQLKTHHTAESICSKFSVDETNTNMECVSLRPFLEQNDLTHIGNHKIMSPCRDHLICNTTEVCLLTDKHEITSNSRVNGYQCMAGCPLGETSSYIVPFGEYARIPASLKHKGCFKMCRCSSNGRFENCQQLQCISYDACMHSDKRIEHGTWFSIECNICSCFAGDITCTRKQCQIPGISDHTFTSLPCNCPPHYVPVCGRNGYTYPSACVSKCAGLQDTDIEFGACRTNKPCKEASCPIYTQCVENRQICLSVMHKPCKQYQCVNMSSSCPVADKPACSLEGRTFPSLCHLLKANQTFSYHGRCMEHCKTTPLCGINGISYRTECEAWNDYTITDYDGECREIGLLTNTLGQRCGSIKCPKINKSHCSIGTIVPPGACCPICGSATRIIYSRKQIDRALQALKGRNMELLSLKGILRSLQALIRVTHCRLSGHLTIESDIFVIVDAIDLQSTPLQLEACKREVEKISTLIDTQSHRITSNVALSSITVANVVGTQSFDDNDINAASQISGFVISYWVYLVISWIWLN